MGYVPCRRVKICNGDGSKLTLRVRCAGVHVQSVRAPRAQCMCTAKVTTCGRSCCHLVPQSRTRWVSSHPVLAFASAQSVAFLGTVEAEVVRPRMRSTRCLGGAGAPPMEDVWQCAMQHPHSSCFAVGEPTRDGIIYGTVEGTPCAACAARYFQGILQLDHRVNAHPNSRRIAP